jgi:hypothetical protein
MNEFTGVCQRICKDNGVKFCNLRAAAQAYLKGHNKENNEKGILTTDGVHLTADGNRLVAEKVAQAIAEALRMRAMQQWIGPGHGLAKWDGADVPFKDKDKSSSLATRSPAARRAHRHHGPGASCGASPGITGSARQ